MNLITIDMDALAKAIDSNTDASEQEARSIINTALAATPSRAPAVQSVPCEDCGGSGVVGDEIYQGEFQPPERERCSSCDGSGRWSTERAPAAVQAEPSADRLNAYLAGHCDALEWAAQVAEANDPRTGDWLYDDRSDLASAIHRGPEMPANVDLLPKAAPAAASNEQIVAGLRRIAKHADDDGAAAIHVDFLDQVIAALAATHESAPAAVSDPKSAWDDQRVQAVYNVLIDEQEPPNGQHWEGFAARRIVDALSEQPAVAPSDSAKPAGALRKPSREWLQKQIDKPGEEMPIAGSPNGWRVEREPNDVIALHRLGTGQPYRYEPGDVVHALLTDMLGNCPECGGRLEYEDGEPWSGPSVGCVECGSSLAAAPTPDVAPEAGKPVAKKLIGWRTEDYLWETADPAKAKNWEANLGILPIFEGDPNTKLSAPSAADGAREKTGAQVISDAVEVCPDCDIADCKHIRARRAAERDALRYRWLRDRSMTEQLQNAYYWSEIAPDMRLKYSFPSLVACDSIGRQITLDDAIDAAIARFERIEAFDAALSAGKGEASGQEDAS